MMTPYLSSLFCCSLLLCSVSASASLVVHYRAAESDKDHRQIYNYRLLALALKKTRADYGDFTLKPAPAMNTARMIHALKNNSHEHFVAEISYQDSFAKSTMDYVPFPIDLGVVGYRICFISPRLARRPTLPAVLELLRHYSMGQGLGWADVAILRHNGFYVEEVGSYENMFRMVAAGRFDLLCRGINELYLEYESHSEIPGLRYDSTLAIHYLLPRFFFIHQSNQLARERIHKGLLRAYQDGSLQRLWQNEYQTSIDQADLAHRTIIFLDNPLIRTLPKDYQQYLYDPIRKQFAIPPQSKADNLNGNSSPH